MTIKSNEVYTLKINSGEELVAKVVAVHGDRIEVSEPVSVAPGPQGIGLVPSLFTADHSHPITINTNSIAMYALTDEPVRVKYIEATTGLVVPDKSIIMG